MAEPSAINESLHGSLYRWSLVVEFRPSGEFVAHSPGSGLVSLSSNPPVSQVPFFAFFAILWDFLGALTCARKKETAGREGYFRRLTIP